MIIGNKEFHFVLASDENYADKLSVTMYSILETHNECEKVSIHILSNNISDKSISKIREVAGKYINSQIVIYNLDNLSELLGKEVNVDHLSLATYARLFIAKFLPENIDTALYLDVDILVKRNLSGLFSLDISNNLVAGVRSLLDLSEDQNKNIHINAGVTLWNLKKCREEDFVGQCIEYIMNSKGKIKFHDQTIINEVCKEKILTIHPRYNVMSGMFFLKYSKFLAVYGLSDYYSKDEYEDAIKNPSIIHLTSWVVGRPWERGCVHPFTKDYRRILNVTPWKYKPLSENKNSTLNLIKRILYRTVPGLVIKYLTKMKRNLKSIVGS